MCNSRLELRLSLDMKAKSIEIGCCPLNILTCTASPLCALKSGVRCPMRQWRQHWGNKTIGEQLRRTSKIGVILTTRFRSQLELLASRLKKLINIFLILISAFQQHILPSKFSDVKPDDLEFFLCAEQGVLGIDAKPKSNPKV